MVKILLKTFKKTLFVGLPLPFSDVPSDAWYVKYLSTGYEVGMIEGMRMEVSCGAWHQSGGVFTMLSRLDTGRYYYEGRIFRCGGRRLVRDCGRLCYVERPGDQFVFFPEDLLTRRERLNFYMNYSSKMPEITPLQHWITRFLEHLEIGKNKSRKTIENYHHYLQRFASYYAKGDPSALTLDDVHGYQMFLNRYVNERSNGLGVKTQNYHLIALRRF